MNSKLVQNLVRQYEGSSAVAAEARLNDLTANLRFLVKYGDFLPDEIMTGGVASIRGKHVIAQERKLQTKVYLDQQDVTGALLNPDNMFESAFQEILFIIGQAKAQGLQYLPYIPLSIVVDKEPGSYRPYLTFVTRFGVTPATHVVATPEPIVATSVAVEAPYPYQQATSAPQAAQTVAQPVSSTQSTPVPDMHPVGPASPLQAAIAETPEELNESPFISSAVAPNPSREQVAALYDSSIPVPPRANVGVEEVALTPANARRGGNRATGPARKGGWPKGKPRKPKVDVVDTNGQI